jgi:flagellar protein FliO/FliZ
MSEGSVVGTLVRLVLSLAAVLTLMVFLARYLQHRQAGTGLAMGAARRRKKTLPMEVVTRQALSRGSSVAVVRVAGQLLLLGVTESAVSVLRELEDVDEPDVVTDELTSPVPAPGFLDIRVLAGSVVETLRQRTVRRG